MSKDAKEIFGAAVQSVDPRKLMRSFKIDADEFSAVKLFAIGKAAEMMAAGVVDQLGERVSAGLVITKDFCKEKLPENIRALKGSHPVPDQKSLDAGAALLEFCESAKSGELVLGMISGGASSLAEVLVDGVSLEDLQRKTSELLKNGADISEINSVRKQLSKIKGGKLANVISPAISRNFILSDVIGDDLSTIASGLTVPESEFENVTNVLIGSNQIATEAARAKAVELGYDVRVLLNPVVGEARDAGKLFADYAMQLLNSQRSTPICLIGGGETVVSINGDGLGGRNQELALSYLSEVMQNKKLEKTSFLSGSTDGGDGPTDAAGAFVDRSVIKNVELNHLSPQKYLDRNDSYHFFELAEGLLKTGPTGTNVCDIQILLIPTST